MLYKIELKWITDVWRHHWVVPPDLRVRDQLLLQRSSNISGSCLWERRDRRLTDGVVWRVQWCRPWRESLALRETVNLPVAQENRIADTSSRNIPSELGWGAQTRWRDYVSWVSLGTPPCTPGQGDGECKVWVYLLTVPSCNLDLDTRQKMNGWMDGYLMSQIICHHCIDGHAERTAKLILEYLTSNNSCLAH